MSGAHATSHTHRHKTWAEAAGLPETAARLEKLPPGLQFPDDFPEPIRFDPGRKLLIYRGFMSSVSYRFLHDLSPDLAFLSALDVLFLASAYILAEPRSARWIWACLVGVVCLGGAAVTAWLLLR
jgi:hypothetical protein